MKLKDYLIKEKITFEKFAKMVGIDRSHVSHIVRGSRKPSLILAKVIQDKTNGAVSMYELASMDATIKYKGDKNDKGKRRG